MNADETSDEATVDVKEVRETECLIMLSWFPVLALFGLRTLWSLSRDGHDADTELAVKI